jgi:MFS family permease
MMANMNAPLNLGLGRRPRRPFRGWAVVAGAFVLMGVGYGVIYSMGNYLEPFSRDFHADRGAVSFVFAVTSILSLVGGVLAGPLADRYGPRPLCLCAALAYLAGFGLASRAQELWQVYLTASLLVGCGVAAVYVPAVATVQRWFVRRRGLASSVATSGLGAGTLLVPLATGWLITAHGWRTASLATGVAAATLTAAAGWLLVGRPEQVGLRPDGAGADGEAPAEQVGRPGGHDLRQAIATREFWWLYLALVATCAVAFFGYGHIIPYAEGRGLPPVTAALGLAAIGAGSWLGRLGLAPLTDWLGHWLSYLLSILLLGLVMVAWLALPVPPVGWLLLIGFLIGTGFGVFVALCPTMIAEHFGQRSLSAVIGAVYTGGGVGAFLGPWLAGLSFDRTGSYRLANLAGAAATLIAAAAVARIRRPRPPGVTTPAG